jgi:hypothetical protein
MKKLLIFLMMLPMWIHGQVIPTTKNPDGSILLSGKGSLGGLNDNVQLRRYKFPTQGNFAVSGYFRSISNKASAVGFMFRNEGTANNKSLATAGVILQRDSLKCVIRYKNNTTMDLVASTPNITLPCHLMEEKNGNSLKYYYSKQPENTAVITWIQVLKVDNVFNEWTGLNHNILNPAGQSTATAVLASLNFKTVTLDETDTRPSCNNGGIFTIASVTKTTGNLYNVDFSAANLSNAQVIIKNTVTNSTVRDITQAITARPQSIDFGTLSAGSYSVQLVGKSCKGITPEKAFQVSGTDPPSNLPSCKNGGSFTIASVTNVSGSTYAIDFNASSLSTTQVLIKSSTGTTVSDFTQAITARPMSIDFGTLATGNYTVQFVGLSCTGTSNAYGFSAVGPVVETTGGIVNTLADLDIPTETMWNRFQPDLIPDFTPAKSIDSKTGESLPNKWFIWHVPYRNLFGSTPQEQLTKMFKKGVTAINASKLPAYYSGMESLVTFDRIVGDAGMGEGSNLDDNLTVFEGWATQGYGYANTYHVPTDTDSKTRMFLTIQDYENKYTNLTTQTAANFHTVGLWAGVNYSNRRYGFQYGAGKNSGGYATSKLYTTESNNVWNLTADNSVPTYYRGKSPAGNSKITAVFELAYTYETFLPNGYQVKDQTGANWFTISHFGSECDNAYGYNSISNANNWAAQLGAHAETYYAYHHAINQDVIAQIKPTNESDNGFHYSAQNAQYNQGRYIQEWKKNGITYLECCTRDNNGNCTQTCEQLSTLGSEYITPFIAEGQVPLVYFSGIKGINWWSSDFSDTAIPKAKAGNPRRGAKYNDVNYGNLDLESYTYTLKALWRLNQKVDLGNGQSYSFNEICDGTEIYLNQLTKVVYPGSSTVTQLRALDWQLLQKTPVRAVVNQAKNVVFVLAFQAYGVEQSQITFKLTDYGANISQVIDVPAGKIVIKAFPLTGAISQGTTIIAPSITANITNPTANQTVTFTSSGCQSSAYITKWYDSAEGNLLGSGLTYSVSATNGAGYYAKCVGTSASSANSNVITFLISSTPTGVTVTEPSLAYNNGEPTYYFSDGHAPSWYDGNAHLPAIFTNQLNYSQSNDLVWLKNDKVKIGINLKRGGQIAWASLINDTSNLVYNGYDGGFQIQLDAYQKKDGYVQNGKYSRAQFDAAAQYTNSTTAPYPNNLASYNVTQGGDFNNHAVSLIKYNKVGTDGYYIKMRPNFYTINSEFSETFIEATYKLEGYAVKIDYVYTSYRHDGQYDGSGFDAGHAPVCFLVNNLRKFKSYTGNQPWTRANKYNDVEDGDLPNETPGQSTSGTPLTKNSKERWSLVYNPDNNKTIGVYANTTETENSFSLKQVNIFDGNGARVGGEFDGGYSIIGRNYDLVPFLSTFDRSNFSKTISSYLIVTPNPNTFIDTVYQISGH